MDSEQLEQLKTKNISQVKLILDDFNKKNADLFNFEKFHENENWYALWQALFEILGDKSLNEIHTHCLNTVRILTRDEVSLQNHDVVDDLNRLLELAHLSSLQPLIADSSEDNVEISLLTNDNNAAPIIVEALKCLCNVVFQSPDCRRYCVKKNITDAILKRFATSEQHPCAMALYDMKFLFLLTALESTARSRLQIDLNGIAYMTEWLDEKLASKQFTDEQLDLIIEMLKVMFNITTSPDRSPNDNEIQSLHLTVVLRELLLNFDIMRNERERSVVTHAINLLTNISSSCLMELSSKCDAKNTDNAHVLQFEGRNVKALDVLLRYLQSVLEEQENEAASSELIPPVLTVLIKCARSNAVMRHYIRNIILPPLRDVSQRPEIGNELRNHLCRFLTLPTMLVRDLAAELLFVCCKENVSRMIKYTGYGNAAGLFANRGLLDCRRVENTEYSSDSEDSDTEEYKQIQHDINPVLGCYEPPKHNPLDGMSDEQKEFEAMQLVQLMDKLHKSGIVQPCRIDDEGKPQPVDHILQLQEELPQQQLEQKRKT